MTQTTGPYCMICGGPAPCARHTFTQAEGEIGQWGNREADPAAPDADSAYSACTWCSADYAALADRLRAAGWTVEPPAIGMTGADHSG